MTKKVFMKRLKSMVVTVATWNLHTRSSTGSSSVNLVPNTSGPPKSSMIPVRSPIM